MIGRVAAGRVARGRGINPGVQSNAGMNNGKSAYIESNGGGYQPRPRPTPQSAGTSMAPYKPNIPPTTRTSSYRNANYHGLTLDRDLSRML